MQGGKEKRLSYMKCANCGTELKDGTLFCPACKSEVQWVPEYHTLETILLQKQMREKSLKEKISNIRGEYCCLDFIGRCGKFCN